MSVSICGVVLFFGFAFGEFNCRREKILEATSTVIQNNVLVKNYTDRGLKLTHVFQTLLSGLEATSGKNSTGEEFIQGKSKTANEIVIPLAMGLTLSGAFLLSLILVKVFLLKGVFAVKIALVILGVVLKKKLQQFGSLMLLEHHKFYFGDVTGQYPTHEPDLSGYGYEYNFVPGFQTPEQKYSSVFKQGQNKRYAHYIK